MKSENKKIVVSSAVTFVLALAIGVVIGYFSRSYKSSYAEDQFKSQEKQMREAIESVNSDSIRSYLQELTKEPHLAGLTREDELTLWIKEQWIQSGLDHVELTTYDMFLSFPNQTNPNKIHLVDQSGTVQFTSQHKEVEVRPGDAHPNFIDAFNAFSPAAEVEGLLVYINYGSVDDIEYLGSIGVSLSGKICIARYGNLFRGNKLDNCFKSGGIGLIVFSDPADVAPLGVEPEDVYPNSIYLPPTGMQRGGVCMDSGDLLTPLWPSVPNAHRIRRNETVLPLIPCQPIGYEDAKTLLEKMGGPDSPTEWKGKISGISYRIGGEMLSEYEGWTVQLKVHNYEKTVQGSNVIGYLIGEVEPDRYVYLSNHRDAWGYGAMDPSSGTANLMELARVLGNLRKKDGWRPRRTIVFCSWAAEESALIGSEEWVQDKIHKIMGRSVGLVNTDTCVSGLIPRVSSSSSLRDVALNSLKYIPHWDGSGSVYDVWKEWYNQDSTTTSPQEEPQIGPLTSGSDHANFIFYSGVPSVNLGFVVDSKNANVRSYPAYHTGYETFFLMDHFVDPGFRGHVACSQLSLHMLLQMANSMIIPYNVRHVSQDIEKAMEGLQSGGISTILSQHEITLDYVKEAIKEFRNATEEYSKFVETLDEDSDPILLKMVNDQLMSLERVFILHQGLPMGRAKNRHAIFSPALFNVYGATAFPGIIDLLYDIDQLEGDALKLREEELKRHVSDLMIVIRNAASFLRPFHEI